MHYIAVCSVRGDTGRLRLGMSSFVRPFSESQPATERAHVVFGVVVLSWVFLSLPMVFLVALSLSLSYDAGTNTFYIYLSTYTHHIQGSYSYINLYVIFIYGKLQSVVGEPLLCVPILLLLHFVCRLSWYVRCADGAPVLLLLWPSISICIVDIFHRSHMCIENVMPSVQPYDICSKSADVWCRPSSMHFASHSANKRRPDANPRIHLQYMYLYILASASALSIETIVVAAGDRRQPFLFSG